MNAKTEPDEGAESAGTGGAPVFPIVLMLLSMFCIASNDAIGKHLTQDYSIWQVLWIRSWVWLGFALIWISRRGGIRNALGSGAPLIQGIRSLILVAEITVFILAFKYLPLGDVTAIGAAPPLVVLVFAVLFLGERVGWHRWTAVAVGFAGMLLISRPGLGVFGWLTLLPLLGVLLWGVYQVLLRLVSRHDSEETTLLWTGCALFLVTGAIAPFHWQNPPDLQTWVWFGLAGLFNTLGHFGLIAAMQRAQASALQPFAYTTVAWALLIGWFAFDERPDILTVCGITAIVAGGLYALYRERRLRAAKSADQS